MNADDWVDEPHWIESGDLLLGSVKVPPDVRTPARNGDTRLWVEIHGEGAQERLDDALSRTRDLFGRLPYLAAEALRLAPDDWRSHYLQGGAGAADYSGLWLDTVEFDADDMIRLSFDFGDLDQLVLELRPDGGLNVTIEP